MAITLGTLAFDEAHTVVQEKHEEVAGRNARRITITGMLLGESTIEALEARLDAILDASSADDLVALSLRTGRRLWVQRLAFSREIARGPLAGTFTLQLEASDPFEESIAQYTTAWNITASGSTLHASALGNTESPAVITLEATGRLVNPAVDDGSVAIAYSGLVEPGQRLVIDGVQGCVLLDGEDVTPYTTGVFPRITPEGTTLTYTDDPSSTHTCAAMVSYRDRWW